MLYRLTHDSQYRYKYVYKNHSLLGFKNRICNACGRNIAIAQYSTNVNDLVLDGGKHYPDYLQYCDAGIGYFLLSQHAIEVLSSNHISGIQKTESVILTEQISLKKNSMPKSHIPAYENVHICGSVELAFQQMSLKKKNYCSLCNQFEWNRKRIPPLVISSSSWDGSDLCIVASMPGEIICSRKMVEVVRDNMLTGFSFEELTVID